MPQIDLSEVTPGEMMEIVRSYEAVIQAMLASNNTLILKLAQRPEASPATMEIVNSWAIFNNSLHEHHHAHIGRVAAPAAGVAERPN